MIESQIDMEAFREKMISLKSLFFDDTTERVQAILQEKGQKIFSASHIRKVRSGRIYVRDIVAALLQVAKENKKVYDAQMNEINNLL